MTDSVPDQYPKHVPEPDKRAQRSCLVVACAAAVVLTFMPDGYLHIFRSSRMRAIELTCASNVKETGLATLMYIQDYDETLPPSATWMDAIGKYTNDPIHLHCPAVTDDARAASYGYAYNARLSNARRDNISYPAECAMLYDSTNLFRNATDKCTSIPVGSDLRHLATTFGFIDGYVKAYWHPADTIARDPITHSKHNSPAPR